MMCDLCEELKERILWLESELGMQEQADDYRKLRSYMIAQPHNGGRGRAVKIILALHAAHGRTMTRWQLMDITSKDEAGDDTRDSKIIDVWVCLARKSLGKEAIETVWGRGFRMSDAGRALVDKILGRPATPQHRQQRTAA